MNLINNVSKHETFLPNTIAGFWLWFLVGVSTLVAVSILPIFTHLVLLAVFGLAHVITELRYVDGRFSQRLGMITLKGMFILIANIVIVRLAVSAGYMPTSLGLTSEIALGVGLVALAAAISPYRPILTILLVMFSTIFAIISPVYTIVIIALLHNLTPLGFLAEALPPVEARYIISILVIPFLGLPLIIASGLPQTLLSTVVAVDTTWVPVAMEPYYQYLTAFLPPELTGSPWAVNIFAAAVFAQTMHYLTVIVVLPRVAKTRTLTGETLIYWPQGIALLATIGSLSALLGIYFVFDYSQARVIYSTLAAVHSWIEIPLFIMIIGGVFRLGDVL